MVWRMVVFRSVVRPRRCRGSGHEPAVVYHTARRPDLGREATVAFLRRESPRPSRVAFRDFGNLHSRARRPRRRAGRSARLLIEMQAERAEARQRAAKALAMEMRAQAQAALMQAQTAILAIQTAYGVDVAVFSEIASKVAAEDLGGVPVEEVEADLAAIAEGLQHPLDLGQVTAYFVVHRSERKESRAEAVKSVRGSLRMGAAIGTIIGPGAK